jgi:hypothetical protein
MGGVEGREGERTGSRKMELFLLYCGETPQKILDAKTVFQLKWWLHFYLSPKQAG